MAGRICRKTSQLQENEVMSLLDEAFEKAYIMDKTTEPDGYGGVITTWAEGAQIECTFAMDSSLQAKLAEKQGVKDLYTITTRKNVVLRYHDWIKRARDGGFYRITSNGDDSETPVSAGLNMRVVSAEKMDSIT